MSSLSTLPQPNEVVVASVLAALNSHHGPKLAHGATSSLAKEFESVTAWMARTAIDLTGGMPNHDNGLHSKDLDIDAGIDVLFAATWNAGALFGSTADGLRSHLGQKMAAVRDGGEAGFETWWKQLVALGEKVLPVLWAADFLLQYPMAMRDDEVFYDLQRSNNSFTKVLDPNKLQALRASGLFSGPELAVTTRAVALRTVLAEHAESLFAAFGMLELEHEVDDLARRSVEADAGARRLAVFANPHTDTPARVPTFQQMGPDTVRVLTMLAIASGSKPHPDESLHPNAEAILAPLPEGVPPAVEDLYRRAVDLIPQSTCERSILPVAPVTMQPLLNGLSFST